MNLWRCCLNVKFIDLNSDRKSIENVNKTFYHWNLMRIYLKSISGYLEKYQKNFWDHKSCCYRFPSIFEALEEECESCHVPPSSSAFNFGVRLTPRLDVDDEFMYGRVQMLLLLEMFFLLEKVICRGKKKWNDCWVVVCVVQNNKNQSRTEVFLFFLSHTR